MLLSVEKFYPRLGGGEVFVDELMSEFAKVNEVYLIYTGEKKESKIHLEPLTDSFVWKNIPLFNRSIIRQYFANIRWKKVVEESIKKHDIDVVFTQLEYTPSTVEVAKKLNVKSMVFIQNYDHFSPFLFFDKDPLEYKMNFLNAPFFYKIQYPFVTKLLEWHKKSLQDADIILSDSAYCSKVLKKHYDLDSKVFFPVINLDDFFIKKKEENNNITFINPIKYKGAEIVLGIARKMPDRQFLVVGGSDKQLIEQFKMLDNVSYLPWCDDMRKIYANTRVLLVPSTWPEPFGRVVLEAGINGIPSITSPLGGLPEAVGDGGRVVKNLFDLNEWVYNIKSLENDKVYRKLSRGARKHALKYKHKLQMKRIKKLLGSII